MEETLQFSNEVLDFANEIFLYVMSELTENRDEWFYRFQNLSNEERAALMKSLADAFNDDTRE